MAMNTDTAMPALLLGEAGSDPIEDRLRETVRSTIEALFDEELAAFLGGTRVRTMADLIAFIEADEALAPARRRNLASSIRRFCAVLGHAPGEAEAAFWFFRVRIAAFAPA